MASMVMARPPTAVAADGRAVRARQGGPSTFPFTHEEHICVPYKVFHVLFEMGVGASWYTSNCFVEVSSQDR